MGIRRFFGKQAAPIPPPRVLKTEIKPKKNDLDFVHIFSSTLRVPKIVDFPWYDDISINTISTFEEEINFGQSVRVTDIEADSSSIKVSEKFIHPNKFFVTYPVVPLQPNSDSRGIQLEISLPNTSDIPLVPETKQIEFPLLPEIPEISKNILLILRAGNIRGKSYGESEWDQAFKKATSKRERKKKETAERIQALQRSFIDLPEEVTSRSTYQVKPNFFDLIKPLLMPPPRILTEGGYDKFLPPGLEPYPYQIEGISRLVNHKYFLLADEMGTGKTVMATLAMRILFQQGKIRSVLVLCPVSVLRVWEEHIHDWSKNELATVKVRGVKQKRRMVWEMPFHVYITSYDTYRADVFDNGKVSGKNKFDLVILDEAQYIKNTSTKRHQAVKKSEYEYLWALTGTPLENDIEDVKSIFSVMSPKLIPQELENPQRLKKIIEPFMLRRLKKDVLKDLPPKIRQTLWLEMSKKQESQYKNILTHGVAELSALHAKDQNVRVHIFALLNKLKQVSNFPKGSLHSPKMDAVKDMIEDISSSDSKALVFSQYIDEGIEKIAMNLKGLGVRKYTGSMTSTQRDTVIDEFKHNPDVQVLLISTRAGSLGLNLTEANYVIHFDHWWNPAIMSQAEDRVHRAGQENRVTVYELWMEAPIEERIFKKLKIKKQLAAEVIDANAEMGLTKEAIFTTDEWLHDIFQISSSDQTRSEKLEEPEIILDVSLEDIKRTESALKNMDPTDFEKLVVDLFKSLGYQSARHVGRTHDRGIDVIAERFLESKRETVIIQCKRYSNNVGVKTARELIGSLEDISNCEKAYLITTSNFTNECKRYAAKMGKKLELMDGEELAKNLLHLGL
jgi:superfamily II DNA or RNA helicase